MKKPTNLGELGDSLYAKTKEIGEANAKVKILEDEKRGIESALLTAMDVAGTDIVRGELATVSKSESVRAQIADVDALYKFVLRHKALHLFERRIAATVYREMLDNRNGKEIPGLTEFKQIRLNVRGL